MAKEERDGAAVQIAGFGCLKRVQVLAEERGSTVINHACQTDWTYGMSVNPDQTGIWILLECPADGAHSLETPITEINTRTVRELHASAL